MSGFFSFGAFSTPVGSLVERSTDNAASAGNIALHLQICDAVNETDNGPKDAVAAIRKRLTGSSKNFHIINLTLTVLETCVKNCGLRFHSKIAQREFLSDLMKVIQPKNNPPTIVRERVLGLIQYWVDAFKGKPQLLAVEELYSQLKNEGVEFPPIDLDTMAPIETPNRSVPEQAQQHSPAGGQLHLSQPVGGGQQQQQQVRSHAQQQPPQPRVPSGPLRPEQVAKMLSELDVVRRNVDIMNEVLTETEPGTASPDDSQLLEELNNTLHQMQGRVAALIERCTDEVILEGNLQINDILNSVFVRYERWLKNSAAASSPQPDTTAAGTLVVGGVATTALTDPTQTGPAISYPSLDDPPPPSYELTTGGVGQLIDLGDTATPQQQPATQTSEAGGDIVAQLAELGVTGQAVSSSSSSQQQQQQQAPAAEDNSDDFDMFAESRKAYSTQGGTYDDNLVQQNVSLSAAIHGRPTTTSTTQEEHTYSNLTDWLAQTDLQQQAQGGAPTSTDHTQESATSAEFDHFLEQRATVDAGLPPARTRPQMQRAEEHADELFSL